MKALKIKSNMGIEVIDLHEDEFEYKFQAMQKAIDCDCIDIVHAVNLPEPYCMVVDDEGLLVGQPIVNLVASYLYGTLEHSQPICGDVLIMKDEYTDEGLDTIGLEAPDIGNVFDLLVKAEAEEKFKAVAIKLNEMLGKDI